MTRRRCPAGLFYCVQRFVGVNTFRIFRANESNLSRMRRKTSLLSVGQLERS